MSNRFPSPPHPFPLQPILARDAPCAATPRADTETHAPRRPFAFYSCVRLGDPEQLARVMAEDPYFW